MLSRRGREEAKSNEYHLETGKFISSLLGRAAMEGTVSTVELLRSHGASLSPRILHFAVLECSRHGSHSVRGMATTNLLVHSKVGFGKLRERMDMMRHTVTVLKVDVNTLDRERTLCYLAGDGGGHGMKR